ncbi:MAG: bifunctional adenosylcobinamide kinase/adenosylcobinamide-phosphate guanylyltransferase [Oscillospiraceae bacterium]|nr:bifunctional adenosylcobinamide kinase/adenosylcobinamide-phosphate guanylyltransferase [Oscillospiraceae bacterium]
MLQKVVNWENVTPYDTEMAEASVRAEINSLVNYAKELKGSVIVVTNEVGMGLVPQNVLGREFRDIAGRANQILAANSKAVYLCISGIPVKIK